MPDPSHINASPTKNFFVEMLTRDIDLDDAILDLLDNCVDGIQRIINKNPASVTDVDQPYSGFEANIIFNASLFEINDNCGGIPLDVAQKYALRMGRPSESELGEKIDDGLFVIGTYGIGMKRAIFKLGRNSEICSQTDSERFRVEISESWLENNNWDLPLYEEDRDPDISNGTRIRVSKIHESIANEIREGSESNLHKRLLAKISQNYSYIINKGFRVKLNGESVTPKPFSLLWYEDSNNNLIAPYIYEGIVNDVEVTLAVGFYRPIPSDQEIEDESKGIRYNSAQAGWTIVVNDRVIVYCDKSRLTGWGEVGVPSFHHQFIAINGVVHFRSNEQRLLPITTTKRGIDASNDTFLALRNQMREGLKIFTSYTNHWKKDRAAAKAMTERAVIKSLSESISEARTHTSLWSAPKDSKTTRSQNKFTPKLPKLTGKEERSNFKTIKFQKPAAEIKLIALNLLEDELADPSEVGISCFNQILRSLKQ